MKKTISIIIAVIVMTICSTSKAVTQSELEDYIFDIFNISGIQYQIRDTDKLKIEKFFKENTITDEQATEIKDTVDKAIKLMNEDGANEPNQLSSHEKKAELLSYAKDIAKTFDYTVSYDATEKRLDVYKNGTMVESLNWGETIEDGKKTITTESKLAKTGSSNYQYIIIPGLVLIAGAMLIVTRNKAND